MPLWGAVVDGFVIRDCVPNESRDCWLDAVRPVEWRGGMIVLVCRKDSHKNWRELQGGWWIEAEIEGGEDEDEDEVRLG